MSKPYYTKTFDRHERDKKRVENGELPGYRFNKALGVEYISRIQELRHYKPKQFAGKRFLLEDWQKKIIAILFGWQKIDSKGRWVRRFRTAFVMIPRKNGKTLLASGIAIADALSGGEIGGEIYIFATKVKQAKICWTGCETMLKQQDPEGENVSSKYTTLTFLDSGTVIQPLARDSKTEDGFSASLAIADEYHAHPDNSMWEVVESSMGVRLDSLMLAITTAGFTLSSPAYSMYKYAKKVIDGIIEDNSFFAFIAEPDKGDDPFKKETWIKANPNYGVSINEEYLERQAQQAQNRPELKNNFLVKHLNVWVNSQEEYISFEKWQECVGEVVERGTLIAGVDLSIADDFTSLVFLYKFEDKYYIKPYFFLPKSRIIEAEREFRAPLIDWVNRGFIIATPGETIDYDYIYKEIANNINDIDAICYDPYRAKILINRVENELNFDNNIPIRQGFLSLSAPTALFRGLVLDKKIIHPDNPVLNWMVSNLVILTDAAGNIKPDKSKNKEKIDGVAAIINSLAYFEAESKTVKPSIYEQRGLL